MEPICQPDFHVHEPALQPFSDRKTPRTGHKRQHLRTRHKMENRQSVHPSQRTAIPPHPSGQKRLGVRIA